MRSWNCVIVAVIMAMVLMVVRVGMGMRMTLSSRIYACVSFKLLNATRMDCSGVCSGCLDTRMRQKLDDCFEIFLGSFWRSR